MKEVRGSSPLPSTMRTELAYLLRPSDVQESTTLQHTEGETPTTISTHTASYPEHVIIVPREDRTDVYYVQEENTLSIPDSYPLYSRQQRLEASLTNGQQCDIPLMKDNTTLKLRVKRK